MGAPGHDGEAMNKLPVLIRPEDLGLRTWVLLARIFHRSVRRVAQVVDRHGLSVAQFEVLAVLDLGAGMTQQELAFRLMVTKGNICGLIDRMGTNGWVERRPDPDDRRVNRLFLTDQGKQLLAETIPPHHRLIRSMMGRLSEKELQTLHELLGRLDDGLGEEAGE
jgi:MarR family transcriptional regulator, organic hydroperoxide resistance regulator